MLDDSLMNILQGQPKKISDSVSLSRTGSWRTTERRRPAEPFMPKLKVPYGNPRRSRTAGTGNRHSLPQLIATPYDARRTIASAVSEEPAQQAASGKNGSIEPPSRRKTARNSDVFSGTSFVHNKPFLSSATGYSP
jgi:hypothetical protein